MLILRIGTGALVLRFARSEILHPTTVTTLGVGRATWVEFGLEACNITANRIARDKPSEDVTVRYVTEPKSIRSKPTKDGQSPPREDASNASCSLMPNIPVPLSRAAAPVNAAASPRVL